MAQMNQGKNRDTSVENGPVDTKQEGRVGLDWETGLDVHTVSCVKQRAGGKLPYNTGNSPQCPVMTQRGGMESEWEAQEEGVYACIELIHAVVQQRLTQHSKAITLQ